MPIPRKAMLTSLLLASMCIHGSASAQSVDEKLRNDIVAFVAVSSTLRCKDVKLTESGQDLNAEMSARLRAGDPVVRRVAQQAAGVELRLIKRFGPKHCENVRQRFPSYVESAD